MGDRWSRPVVLLVILGSLGCHSTRRVARPVDQERLLNIAELFESQGDLQLASNMYREVLKNDPHQVDATRRIAEIAADLRQPVAPTLATPQVEMEPIELASADDANPSLEAQSSDAQSSIALESAAAVTIADGPDLTEQEYAVEPATGARAAGSDPESRPMTETVPKGTPLLPSLVIPSRAPAVGNANVVGRESVPPQKRTDGIHVESGHMALQEPEQPLEVESEDLPVGSGAVELHEGPPLTQRDQASPVPTQPFVSPQVARKVARRRGQLVKFQLRTRLNFQGVLPYREHQLDVVDDLPGRAVIREEIPQAIDATPIASPFGRPQPAPVMPDVEQTLAPDSDEPEWAVDSRVRALADGLVDRDASIRVMSAFELGELTSEARPAIPALLDAMTEERNPMVRVLLAEALAKVSSGDERALQVLSNALNQDDSCVRQLAVLAVSEVVTRLAGAQRSKRSEVTNDVWDRFVSEVSSGIRNAMHEESKPIRDAARQAGSRIGIQEPTSVTP